MMQSSKNNDFNASDIRRYHAGEMSAAEMQAIEKAALDDPFLADALEGFALTATPEQDLSEIRERMQQKKERNPARAIWWQAAAVLLLISVGLWFFVRVDDPEKQSVARVEEDTSNTTTALAPSAAPTSSQPQTQSTADSTQVKMANQPAARSKKIPPAPTRRDVILSQSQADSGGYFATTYSAPQAARATANPGSAMQEKQDSLKTVDVVMTPLPNMESKEVVMRRGQASKTKSVREFVIADTLEPTEGIARYNDYVAANLKQPDAPPDKSQGGAVRLSFDVDDSGSPINIAVVKSDCPACDKEAIRLVSEGPKWKKKKGRKGAITIKF